MFVQKFQGTADGYLITIGTRQFAMLQRWTTRSRQTTIDSGIIAPRMGWMAAAEYVPYGIRHPDGTWTVSENPKPINGSRSATVGMLINNIEPNKKAHIERDSFIEIFNQEYKEGLNEEASFKCPH